jgi:hypothetical protein
MIPLGRADLGANSGDYERADGGRTSVSSLHEKVPTANCYLGRLWEFLHPLAMGLPSQAPEIRPPRDWYAGDFSWGPAPRLPEGSRGWTSLQEGL